MRVSALKYSFLFLFSLFFYVKGNAQLTISTANINSCSSSILISVSGGTGAYTYAWSYSPPADGVNFTPIAATTRFINNLVAGHYFVTVTDVNNGDTVDGTYQVHDAFDLIASVVFNGLVCAEDPTSGVIILNFDNGEPPYTWTLYDIDNGLSTVNSGITGNNDFFILIDDDTNGIGLTTGNYRFEWTDTSGCTGTEDITVTAPPALDLTATPTGVTCFGDSDGEVDINVTGGWGADYVISIVPFGVTPQSVTTPGAWTTIGNGINYTETGLSAGTYQVYYYDRLALPPFTTTYGLDVGDYSCLKSETFTIDSPDELLSNNISGEALACFGDTNGNITGNITGGTAPYTITLDPNITNQIVATDDGSYDFVGLGAGTYTFTIEDSLGCITNVQAEITEPTDLITSISSFTHATCNGDANGSITIDVSGGNAPYNFDINGNITAPNSTNGNLYTFNGLSAGVYTIFITDQTCSTPNFLNHTVEEPFAIVVTTTGSSLTCNGDTNGTIDAQINYGTAPYRITLVQTGAFIDVANNGDSFNFTGLAAGTYDFNVEDGVGCVATATETVIEPNPITINATGSTLACFGDTNGTINGTVSGGTAPYTVTLDATAESVNVNANEGAFIFTSLLAAGDYNITITDNAGCITTPQVSITEPDELIATFVSKTDALCFNGASGEIVVDITGGNLPYVFDINGNPGVATNVGDTYTFSGLGTGNYVITITDQEDCTASTVINEDLTQPTQVTLALDAIRNISCFNGTDGFITVGVAGGTPNYTFTLNGITSNTVDNGDGTWTFPNLSAGDYNITVTDANGCASNPAQVDQTLIQPDEIIYNATKEDISCNGLADGKVIVDNFNGAYNYELVDITAPLAPITSIVQGADLEYQNLDAATYRLTVSDPAGNNGTTCTSTVEFEILEPTAISVDTSLISVVNSGTGPQLNISCNGGTDGVIDIATSGGTGTHSYAWSTLDGTIPVGTENNEDLYNLTAGTYTVLITDQNNCSESFDYTLNEPRVLNSTATLTQNNSCNGGIDGIITSTILNSGSVDGITYTYTITGTPALPGSYTSTQNTTSLSTTFENLPAGDYEIKIEDENGCSSTSATITITEPSNPITVSNTISDFNGSGVSCNGDTNGTITINNITGGTPNYTISWIGPNGFTSNATNLTDLEAGTYDLTVTDANNCSYQEQFILTEPNPLTLTAELFNYNGFGVSGNGLSDGSITTTVLGGTPTYTYTWSTLNGIIPVGQENNSNLTGLSIGTYTLNIIDANGCTISESWTITEPEELLITESSHVNILCFGDATGSIEVTVTQPSVAPYDYILTTTVGGTVIEQVDDLNATSYIFDNLVAGTYNVSVVDANGNTANITSIIVTQPAAALKVDSEVTEFNGFQISCNGANNANINIVISGGTPNYTISWTGPNGFTSNATTINNPAAGTYNLTVTDANNCIYQEQIDIVEPDEVFINTISASNITCNGNSDGSILINPTGGTGVYTFAWTKDGNPYATTEDLTNLGAGAYQLIVSDENGCTKTEDYTIINPNPLIITTDTTTDIVCFGDSTGAIDISVSGGTPNYSYSWSLNGTVVATTEDLTNVTSGTYLITVTDASGCEETSSIELTSATEIVIDYTTTAISCYNANDGTIDVTLSGGVGPYTHTWSDLGNGLTRTNLAPGPYTITVTDASGCEQTAIIEIIDAPVFETNPIVTNISCFGEVDGMIDLNINGGQAPLTVLWQDDASAGIVRNNLGAGTYSVLVTDATGCTINQNFTINEPAVISLDAIIVNATDCDDPNSGSLDLQVSGGTAPFTYVWSNGTTSEDLQNIGANEYTVTVTDSRGCEQQATYTITRQAPLELNVITTPQPNCLTRTVEQRNELQISGGVAPYSIVWSSGTVSGSNGEIMTTGQNGTVIAEVTDSLGCTKELVFDVDLLAIGDPSFDYTSLSFTRFGTLSVNDPVTFTSTSTGDAVSFFWDFGDGATSTDENPIHDYEVVGTYTITLTVTYPYGCSYSYSQTLVFGLGYSLVVPTGFTPNGDGINDTIRPVYTGMDTVSMKVYDTWGGLVYSETGVDLAGWDGMINGSYAENGNYSIIVQATSFNGVVLTKNTPIVLIK